MAGTAGFASGSLDMEAPHPPTQLTRRLNEGGGEGGANEDDSRPGARGTASIQRDCPRGLLCASTRSLPRAKRLAWFSPMF